MNTAIRRIEELERRSEWFEAFHHIEGVLAWAVASGQCSASEAAGHLSEMKRMVPLELFVAGKWTPPPDWIPQTPADASKTVTMITVFSEWEQSQGIAP
ncbi:MAG: hypothetical protein ACR2OE_08855 [Thermomicrobiales bacterium]